MNSLKSLFILKYKLITLIIWFNWFVSSFVYFGITFLLPITLKELRNTKKNNNKYSYTVIL